MALVPLIAGDARLHARGVVPRLGGPDPFFFFLLDALVAVRSIRTHTRPTSLCMHHGQKTPRCKFPLKKKGKKYVLIFFFLFFFFNKKRKSHVASLPRCLRTGPSFAL